MTEKRPAKQLIDGLEYLRELGFSDLVIPAGDAPADSTAENHPPDVSGSDRGGQLEALEREAQACTDCQLSDGRHRVVFGSGGVEADLMLIGEGPGAEEDRQGLPFVGPAGELLTKILDAIGIDRKDAYIANIVKCRPPGNRDPLPEEAAACRSYLDRQIEIVQPRVIVALGRVAAQDLLDSDLALGKLRGRWHRVKGIPTRVTYHPAALLRNTGWKRPTWEDMQIVRDRLREESGHS